MHVRTVSSIILVGTCGQLILQQRDNVPGILYPGLIGLFGGHREVEETALQCAQRELHEEIGQLLPLERFAPLLSFEARFHGDFVLHDDVFVARDVPSDALAVTEGRPLFVKLGELCALYGRMAPATSFAIRYFVTTGEDAAPNAELPEKEQQPERPTLDAEPSQQQ